MNPVTVIFEIDGDCVTPIRLAKSIVDSKVMSNQELDELCEYLRTYTRYRRSEDAYYD